MEGKLCLFVNDQSCSANVMTPKGAGAGAGRLVLGAWRLYVLHIQPAATIYAGYESAV